MGSHQETVARDGGGGELAWLQVVTNIYQLLEPEVVACWLLPLPVASDQVSIPVVGLLARTLFQNRHICLLKNEMEKGTFRPDLSLTNKLHVKENKAIARVSVER